MSRIDAVVTVAKPADGRRAEGIASLGAAKLRKRSQELRAGDRVYRTLREKIRTLLVG